MRKQGGQRKFVVNQTQIDPRTKAPLQEKLARFELIYSVIGVIIGSFCIIAGVILFLNGVSGGSSWTASAFGIKSKLTDAAPGSILFVVGLFIVLVTRYKFKHAKSV